MGAFKYVSVTLSLLLGLGVTRLLTGVVGVFQARSRATVRWVPLVWAAAIFITQLQFWWAIIELETLVKTWTIGHFASLLLLPLLLFVASALVLPQTLDAEEDLATFFERDGRWGLVCLSAYSVLAIGANALLFDAGPLSWAGAVLAVEAALPAVYLAAKSERVRAGTTITYLFAVVAGAWMVSKHSY
jgi:hypothetical protein